MHEYQEIDGHDCGDTTDSDNICTIVVDGDDGYFAGADCPCEDPRHTEL